MARQPLVTSIVLLSLAARAAAAVALQPAAATTAVLHRGDHTLLTWRDGPPYLSVPKSVDEPWARYSSGRRMLRLETGWYALDLDTEKADIPGFSRYPSARDEAGASASALKAAPLASAQLHLAIRVETAIYTCRGRRAFAVDASGRPSSPEDFPVRVLESGRFLQKVALYELEFMDAAGRAFDGFAHLEIAAWPDRLAITLAVAPNRPFTGAQASVRLQTEGGMDALIAGPASAWPAGQEHRTTLTISAAGHALAPTPPDGVSVAAMPREGARAASVQWNPEELCYRVRLDAAPWPAGDNGAYPEAMLDGWERYAVTLENGSDQEHVLALNFDHAMTRMLTGCVPLLLDERGHPAGIPVQTSKNWHRSRTGTAVPFMGPWLHGRAWVHVAPRSRVNLQYALVYARWGGVPSASVAQLSLVGWGHNGFWDQFALGTFGESFCFQPLRVQRRSLITDFRPLYQLGMASGARFAWTSNVGGGDTMVRHDAQGEYVPFKRHVTRYVSHGPNLAQLDYAELSADGAVESEVSVRLPRTDDMVRVYLQVRYEVRRRVEFSRLVLFQLGADYYSDTDSPKIAWGDARGLAAEHAPRGTDALPRWIATGEMPWISLHGQPRDDFARSGQGTRGLVVRNWHATIGGKSVASPTFAAARGMPPKHPLRAEIVPPAGVTALEPGDRVDMLLEIFTQPLAAERYHGPDEGLRAALVAGANTWRPAHREAAENRPTLVLGRASSAGMAPANVGFQLPITLDWRNVAGGISPADGAGETAFAIQGGLGWIPVRLTGLPRPDAVELWRETRGGREPVVQGPPGRAYWQSDYDATSRTWSLTYNLRASEDRTAYFARPRTAADVAPVP